MPDTYGKITGNDWMNFASAMGSAFGDEKKRKINEARDTMLAQHGNVRGVIDNVDPNTLDPYQLEAYSGMSKNYSQAMGDRETSLVNNAVKKYEQELESNGGDFYGLTEPTTREEHAALASMMDSYSKTTEGKSSLDKQLNQVVRNQVENAMPLYKKAEEFARKGDYVSMRPYLTQMSKILGSGAYYYDDDGTGYLVKRFRTDNTGDYEDIAHLTEEEVLSELDDILRGNKIGEGDEVHPELARIAKATMRATGQGNSEKAMNLADDIVFRDRSGKEFRGVIQNDPYGVGASRVFLYGPNGERVYNQATDYKTQDPQTATSMINGDGNFTLQELHENGFVRENLDREKDMATLKNTEQRTKTSAAQEDSARASEALTKRSMTLKEKEAKTKAEKEANKANSDSIAELEKSMKFVGAQLAEKTGMSDFAAILSGNPESMDQQERNSTVSAVTELARSGFDVEKQLAGRYLKMLGQWDELRFGGQTKAAPSGAGQGQTPAMGKKQNTGVQSWKDYR